MLRRVFCKLLLVAIVIFSLLTLSNAVLAQGRSSNAFERVKELQERHTEKLMAKKGVVGTAVGLNEKGRHIVMVLLEKGGVPGIPHELEGVPVQKLITGKIYSLAKPPKKPKPPTGLTATVEGLDVLLSWNPSRTPSVVSYRVWRLEVSAESYMELAEVTDTSYTDTDLEAGIYYYVVTAVDENSLDSAPSNEVLAIIDYGIIDETPPDPPTGLLATAVSSTQIDLTWDLNPENDLAYYNVYDSVAGFIASLYSNSYSDTGLTPDTTYEYYVRAVDTSKNESESSAPASATTKAAPANPWQFDRPVPIGVSTGHPDITAGTIGCRVIDTSGNVYALSNNHVYADENRTSIGEYVIQPGTFDGGALPDDYIGMLANYEPIVFLDDNPLAINIMDAAIASTTTSLLGNSTPPDGYGVPSSSTVAATWRLSVQKYGRTTGLTSGRVVATNGTVDVSYDSGVARFVGQVIIRPGGFSAGGDSGSLVVTQEGNNPVGLLFAGSATITIANPIDVVLDTLGGNIGSTLTIDDSQ